MVHSTSVADWVADGVGVHNEEPASTINGELNGDLTLQRTLDLPIV
jgi:hypothetical protein